MVKKTYIMPKALTVVLGTCQMMAASKPIGDTPTDPDEFEVKEQAGITDKNVWDEEW